MAIEGANGALRQIEETVVQMAAYVEELIAKALLAMTLADDRLADEVIASDPIADDMRGLVRQSVLQTIERWAPVGPLLRKIIAYQFISEQLERLGDYAVHVARGARISYRSMPLEIAGQMGEMARLVRQQVRDGVRALAEADGALARQVCLGDNQIDALYHELFLALQEFMRAQPEKVREGTLMLFALRDLERIGDRMANVCEDVIYILTGIHENLN